MEHNISRAQMDEIFADIARQRKLDEEDWKAERLRQRQEDRHLEINKEEVK